MHRKNIAIALAATATAATAAAADTIDVKFTGTGRGGVAKINIDGSNKTVFAGQLHHTLSSGTGDGANLEGDFLTFCADLTQYVTSSTETYDVTDIESLPDAPEFAGMGPDAAQAIAEIYQAAGGDQLAADADNALAMAFQLAVWEIVYDFDEAEGAASLDFDEGDFRVKKIKNGLASSVNDFVDDLFAAVGSGASAPGLYGLASNSSQDQIVMVPLPAPAILAATGLLGIAAVRRRFA